VGFERQVGWNCVRKTGCNQFDGAIAPSNLIYSWVKLLREFAISYIRKYLDLNFEIISDITNIESIAVGNSIREVERLRKTYGSGRWRKLKGIATILLNDGTVCTDELHWYEAHGIGKKEIKIKRILSE